MDLNHAEWRKSSRSGGGANCVEVRRINDTIQVRDTKNPDGPVLSFTPSEWDAFLDGVHKGEFDL